MNKFVVEDIIKKGVNIKKITLENDCSKVILLSYGAGVYQYVFDNQDLIIVPKTIEDYMDDLTYFGKTMGRTSGRLVVPSYSINGKSYEVKPFRSDYTSLHGGEHGFSTKNFELVNCNEHLATFRYVSKDLEEGYPGELTLDVTYELKEDGTLDIKHHATTTKDTLCNITSHVYFNLNQDKETIDEHMLQINASFYLDIDENYLLKQKKSVEKTPFDFRELSMFKKHIDAMKTTSFYGFDHTWIFDDSKDNEPNAIAYDHVNNIGIKAYTSYPAVVLYTSNNPAGIPLQGPFKGDAIHSSFTLECQFEPGGIHHDHLNKAILKKGETYQHFIKYEPFRK